MKGCVAGCVVLSFLTTVVIYGLGVVREIAYLTVSSSLQRIENRRGMELVMPSVYTHYRSTDSSGIYNRYVAN